jgi:hypothetical protein
MVGGEWTMTATAGTSLHDTWTWGPGRHSLRVTTHGEAASGDPWRELTAVYWHPAFDQIRVLSLHPDIPGIGRGVFEGSIELDGESADATSDLYQPGAKRRISRRWTFDGPDANHTVLMESTQGGAFQLLAEWDYFRSQTLTPVSPPPGSDAPQPSERMQPFERLLAGTWAVAARGEDRLASGSAVSLRSKLEWIPYVDAISARTVALGAGEDAALVDASIYHHVGTGKLRCLALTSRGGVYEGDVIVLDDGSLQLELTGYEGERVSPYLVRIEFEDGGSLRQRVWSGASDQRELVLDVRHELLDVK